MKTATFFRILGACSSLLTAVLAYAAVTHTGIIGLIPMSFSLLAAIGSFDTAREQDEKQEREDRL